MLYKFDQCSGRIQAMPHHDKEFMNFVTASELLVCMDLQYRSETSPDKYFESDDTYQNGLKVLVGIGISTTYSYTHCSLDNGKSNSSKSVSNFGKLLMQPVAVGSQCHLAERQTKQFYRLHAITRK